MAREFAQIKLSIWSDDDWRDLSPDARYLYLSLLTSPTLTHCGTADWRPARMSALNGQDVQTIAEAGAELVESLHLVIDDATEEVLIRSFIRNDGLMKQPRMAVSMANAHSGLGSRPIRGVLVHELRRLRADFPELSGWEKDKATDLLQMEPIDPKTFPLGKGPFGGPFTPSLGETQRSVWGSPTPSPATTPATTDSRHTPSQNEAAPANAVAVTVHARFNEFWDAYSKKRGKGAAEKAFTKAARKADPSEIIRAAHVHADYHQIKRTEFKFIPYPATWLNESRWGDDLDQDEQGPTTRLDGFRDVHEELVRRQQSKQSDVRQIGGSR